MGPHGEAILLVVSSEARAAVFGRNEQPGWASFPKAKTDTPYSARVLIHDETDVRSVEIAGETRAYPRVALLNDDEILLAGTRCRRFADGTHELNGHVYGLDGQLRRQFLLGDGIEHIATDVRGEIWVGYFDEGVFGNYGWGAMTTSEEQESPVGWPGLVRFDAEGNMTWRYEPPEGNWHHRRLLRAQCRAERDVDLLLLILPTGQDQSGRNRKRLDDTSVGRKGYRR
jgi:hypothetical protein